LLIVIIVLGILAAIVAFALGGVSSQSSVAACNSDAKSVSTAVSAYEAHNNGNSPATIGALVASANGGPYLKTLPGDAYYLITLDSTGDVLVSLATGTSSGTPLTQSQIAAIPAQTPGIALTASGDTFTAVSVDPGYTWQVLPGPAVIATAAEQYEGSGAFTWGSDPSVTPADQNQNICVGA
jgi:general secretion pathway protein G